MEIYRALFRIYLAIYRALSRPLRSAVSMGSFRFGQAGGRRASNSAVLAPGDPDPAPGRATDFFDYRGVADRKDVAVLHGQEFPLGRYLHPRRGVYDEIGLPFSTLQRHAAVIGPTGVGKTKSVLVPWIATALRRGDCVIAVDIAGDLLMDLFTHRAATGSLDAAWAKWDYTDPANSLSWNWISSLGDDESIVTAVECLIGRPRPNDPQPYFHQRDSRILRGLLELSPVARNVSTGRDLVALLRDEAQLTNLVNSSLRNPGAQRLYDIVGRAGPDYLQVMSGAINALTPWEHAGLDAVTRRIQLDIPTVFLHPSLLVVVAPIHGGSTSEAASALILGQVINQLYRRFTRQDGRHVFLVIDEAARLVDRIRFEELLSVARRARVSVILATQDVGQFRDEGERLAILGNCSTYVSLPGPSKANREYLQSRIGTRYQSGTTISQQFGHARGASTSTSISSAPVLGDREIMSPPWGARTCIIHCPQLVNKPVLANLTRSEFSN